MYKDELIEKIIAQDFPEKSYVVFGSGRLAVAGIRPTDDIDLVVTPELFSDLERRGWQKVYRLTENPMLKYDDFDVSTSWNFGKYHTSLQLLLDGADIIDGVPFVNLGEVRKWKAEMGRPKDIDDIVLIDAYLAGHRS